MQDLAALGTALAAMSEHDDDERYGGCLMLSALPGAPCAEPSRLERISAWLRRRTPAE